MTTAIKSSSISFAFVSITIIALELFSMGVLSAQPAEVSRPVIKTSALIFAGKKRVPSSRENLGGMRRTTRSGGTKLAGTRGLCELDLVALIPSSNIGITTTDRPTVWFYLPTNSKSVKSINFRLLDENDQEIWRTQSSPQSNKIGVGLLGFSYQGPLLANGIYRWEFSYQQSECNKPQELSGYIQKETAPNLVLPEDRRERLHTYAQNGIWHELLTELITLRQQNPLDAGLIADFKSLLSESPDVKYLSLDNSGGNDLDLVEQIVKAQAIN
jgi:hypothetical protein